MLQIGQVFDREAIAEIPTDDAGPIEAKEAARRARPLQTHERAPQRAAMGLTRHSVERRARARSKGRTRACCRSTGLQRKGRMHS